MSSRNVFIAAEERPKANQLNKSLNWLATEIRKGHRNYQTLEETAKQQIEAAGFRPDYLQVCCKKSLKLADINDRELIVLGAMFTQAARLIDNVSLTIETW